MYNRSYVLTIMLVFIYQVSAANPFKRTTQDYLYLKPDVAHAFESKDLYVVTLPSPRYRQEVLFKNSRVFNLTASKVKKFDSFIAVDTEFYFAKFPGVFFENCVFKNVKFVQSDLSFIKFKNCQIENVSVESSITYGQK